MEIRNDKLTIYIDKHEKVFRHITSKFDELGVRWVMRSYKAADYSFAYDGVDYSLEWRCEKKAHFNELYNNLTGKRKQFNNELRKLLACPNVILLIEEPSRDIAIMNLKKKHYKMNITTFPAKLDTWVHFRQYERTKANVNPIEIVYCDKRNTAETIIKLINDYLKANKNQ